MALGPGMGIFTSYARVLEPDDSEMTVRTAYSFGKPGGLRRAFVSSRQRCDNSHEPRSQSAGKSHRALCNEGR